MCGASPVPPPVHSSSLIDDLSRFKEQGINRRCSSSIGTAAVVNNGLQLMGIGELPVCVSTQFQIVAVAQCFFPIEFNATVSSSPFQSSSGIHNDFTAYSTHGEEIDTNSIIGIASYIASIHCGRGPWIALDASINRVEPKVALLVGITKNDTRVLIGRPELSINIPCSPVLDVEIIGINVWNVGFFATSRFSIEFTECVEFLDGGNSPIRVTSQAKDGNVILDLCIGQAIAIDVFGPHEASIEIRNRTISIVLKALGQCGEFGILAGTGTCDFGQLSSLSTTTRSAWWTTWTKTSCSLIPRAWNFSTWTASSTSTGTTSSASTTSTS
mmetsp:Transcript_3857/g.8838  ORF Transcript_3857/g.8838 Transcript_3857/m.8838 type:complete len:328 (+) Transcript_3857:3899-4882(+)